MKRSILLLLVLLVSQAYPQTAAEKLLLPMGKKKAVAVAAVPDTIAPGKSGFTKVVPYQGTTFRDTVVAGHTLAGVNGTREGLTIWNKYRVRQKGTITKVAFSMWDTAGVTELYCTVWRKVGTKYNRIGTSENLIGSRAYRTRVEVTLASPITGVLPGDLIGGKNVQTSTAGGWESYTPRTGSKVYRTSAAAADNQFDWEAQSAFTDYYTCFFEAYMDPPRFVFLGNSLTSSGSSYCNESGSNTPDSTMPGKLIALADSTYPGRNYTYQNMGVSGDASDNILARFKRDLLARPIATDPRHYGGMPAYAILWWGVNDIVGVTTTVNYKNRYREILDSCKANSIIPVIVGIAPYTAGTNAQMQHRDTLNTWLYSLADSGYSAKVVNLDSYVGQFRAGGDAGNLWDIQTAYDFGDNTHFNVAGYYMIARKIWKALHP